MTGTARVLTSELGGSPLSRLVQVGEAPAAWFPARPATVDQWRDRIEAVRSTSQVDWWIAVRDAAQPTAGSPAAKRLAAVIEGHGVVVTTGQQPGLFGGPVYTWSKALSALALADALESETGVPVAPVFWAATDDADLAEASWTIVGGTDGAERLALEATAPEGTRMADVPLPDLGPILDRLAAACGSTADPRPLDLARRAWRKGSTIGAAHVELLRGILEPLGITVIDAAHPAMGIAAHPTLVRALHERERVHRALADRAAAIRAAGHEPQVHEMEDLTLVFHRRDGRRSRVARAHAAVTVASAEPGTLSPNVLLRPVVERALLPTVAYVAGPAELAYFTQVSAVADALEAESPLAVPRWSCTIMEPDVSGILERHGLVIADLADPHAAETRLARAAWPDGVADAVARLRRDLAAGLTAVRDAVHDEDGLMPIAPVDGLARTFSVRIGRLERRITAAMKRREVAMARDLRIARGSLFPGGLRQERALNLLPLLARYGPALLASMRQDAGRHARVMVGAGSTSGALP
jgi:bacillithiol biosynthesis cysteine-adding enzyme BshC